MCAHSCCLFGFTGCCCCCCVVGFKNSKQTKMSRLLIVEASKHSAREHLLQIEIIGVVPFGKMMCERETQSVHDPRYEKCIHKVSNEWETKRSNKRKIENMTMQHCDCFLYANVSLFFSFACVWCLYGVPLCSVALRFACTFACTLSKSPQHIVFTSNCNQHDHYAANVCYPRCLRGFSLRFFTSFNHTAFSLATQTHILLRCVAFYDWEKRGDDSDGSSNCSNAMYRLNDIKWWIVCRMMDTK